ncbi:hypothetical protein SLEP1_g55746 [Rubroshorea leprosula]|uniref:Uncharacterized protein n=1 Tax=Rubroshorea leprosula TaxID=152421 RepID=A0AAV5MHH6_9ROSI|nr:hypothetical protein SLEP1_g55746 [Rubroshorea leprosula]
MTFDEVIVSRRADMRVLSKSLHWVSINPKPIVVDFDFLLSFVSSPSNLIKYCRKQSREVGGVVELQPCATL